MIFSAINLHLKTCSHMFVWFPHSNLHIYEHVPSCSYHFSMSFPFKPPFMNMFLHVPIIFPWASHSNLHFWTCFFMFLALFHELPIQTSIYEQFPTSSSYFPSIFPLQNLHCGNSWPDISSSPRLSMLAPGWLMANISSLLQPVDQKSVSNTATAWHVPLGLIQWIGFKMYIHRYLHLAER